VSKFKTRVLPSITGYLKKTGKLPQTLCFSLAALIAFYNGRDYANAELTGSRNNAAYPITDDEAILKRFEALYAQAGSLDAGAARNIVHAVLSDIGWWGENLTAHAGLEDAVALYLAAIWKDGIKAMIEKVVA
jgi:tagaturonate reductase